MRQHQQPAPLQSPIQQSPMQRYSPAPGMRHRMPVEFPVAQRQQQVLAGQRRRPHPSPRASPARSASASSILQRVSPGRVLHQRSLSERFNPQQQPLPPRRHRQLPVGGPLPPRHHAMPVRSEAAQSLRELVGLAHTHSIQQGETMDRLVAEHTRLYSPVVPTQVLYGGDEEMLIRNGDDAPFGDDTQFGDDAQYRLLPRPGYDGYDDQYFDQSSSYHEQPTNAAQPNYNDILPDGSRRSNNNAQPSAQQYSNDVAQPNYNNVQPDGSHSRFGAEAFQEEEERNDSVSFGTENPFDHGTVERTDEEPVIQEESKADIVQEEPKANLRGGELSDVTK